jgi:hypothetical protein
LRRHQRRSTALSKTVCSGSQNDIKAESALAIHLSYCDERAAVTQMKKGGEKNDENLCNYSSSGSYRGFSCCWMPETGFRTCNIVSSDIDRHFNRNTDSSCNAGSTCKEVINKSNICGPLVCPGGLFLLKITHGRLYRYTCHMVASKSSEGTLN